MPKPASKSADYLAYLALRVAAMFFHMFNWRAIYKAAAWMGDFWFAVDKRHRLRAMEHLRQSFPDWPEAKIESVAQGSFRNLVYLAIEVLLVTRLITPRTWRRYVKLTSMQEVARMLVSRSRGLIFISGHFGGWEMNGYTMAAVGFDGYAVAKALDNHYLNDYLLGVRERMGLRILDKAGATAQIPAILTRGQYVGFVADQDAGARGEFVDFFGRPASTYKAPALLAMQYEAPLAVGYSRRIGEQFSFEFGMQRIIYPDEWANRDDPVNWITQEYTAALEEVVRSSPEQYLWIYRRWKTEPPARKQPSKTAERSADEN